MRRGATPRGMDAFSYLSVLLSIILGLAITQVLQGVRGLLLARARVRLYLPTLLWSGLILLIATQMWWSSFGLANHTEWTFGAFGMVLLQTVLLYMLAALVLPDFPAAETHDLKAHYYREARPFYAMFIATLAVSLLKDMVIDGRPPAGENVAFHALFATAALTAIVSRRERLHEALAIGFSVLMAGYIWLLFSRLG